jgi:hypothetical protein
MKIFIMHMHIIFTTHIITPSISSSITWSCFRTVGHPNTFKVKAAKRTGKMEREKTFSYAFLGGRTEGQPVCPFELVPLPFFLGAASNFSSSTCEAE